MVSMVLHVYFSSIAKVFRLVDKREYVNCLSLKILLTNHVSIFFFVYGWRLAFLLKLIFSYPMYSLCRFFTNASNFLLWTLVILLKFVRSCK